MTNIEAIETLRANYPDACYEQLREAVDTAIEALKAQNATGDTISRQRAIDALYSVNEYNARSVKAIKTLPSAQPEIVRCKDCKYNVSSHKCLHPESFFLVPDDDFYCGYAERRTNER